MAMLEEERGYYDENLEEWLQKYSQRFVLVKGRTLIGTFDTHEDAERAAARRFGLESALIRRVQRHQPVYSNPAYTLGLMNVRLPLKPGELNAYPEYLPNPPTQ